MYHNTNPNRIEAHDGTEVQSAELDASNPEEPLLTVVYKLQPGAYDSADLQLHSTNGVNHRYHPVVRKAAGRTAKKSKSPESVPEAQGEEKE